MVRLDVLNAYFIHRWIICLLAEVVFEPTTPMLVKTLMPHGIATSSEYLTLQIDQAYIIIRIVGKIHESATNVFLN